VQLWDRQFCWSHARRLWEKQGAEDAVTKKLRAVEAPRTELLICPNPQPKGYGALHLIAADPLMAAVR
jgi:hypothetical protein